MEEGRPKKERRQRRRFSDEYKASTVKLVLSGRKTAGQVARDLDLTETAVRHWVKQAQVDAGKGPTGALTTAEKEELAKLRKEVRELKMERETLVKAAALMDPHEHVTTPPARAAAETPTNMILRCSIRA